MYLLGTNIAVATIRGRPAIVRDRLRAAVGTEERVAGRLRQDLAAGGRMIGLYDVLIAAQALCRELTLITPNTREFSRVPRLSTEDWAVDDAQQEQ